MIFFKKYEYAASCTRLSQGFTLGVNQQPRCI